MVESFYAASISPAAAGGEDGGGQGPAVLCPLCQEAGLVQRQGVILCPTKDLRLDTSVEGLGLEDLRQRLAAAFTEHAAAGCRGRLVFEQRAAAGGNSLLAMCEECSMLDIVM